MIESQAITGDRSELTGIIHQIRKRWRMKLAMRGAAFVRGRRRAGAAGLGLRARAAEVQPRLHHRVPRGDDHDRRRAGRIFLRAAAVAARHRRTGGALSRRVRAVAGNRHPERHRGGAEANVTTSSQSPALARRLVEQAIERCAAIEHGRKLEAKPFKRYSTVLATTVVTALLIFLLGPAYLRHGASALLLFTGDLVEASPYRIDVTPGNTTVPRGSDQVISAKIQGFASGSGRAAGPQGREPAVRARADGVQPGHQDVRRHAVRPADVDRLLRRIRRREVVRLHDARGGPAVCEAARNGIRVPGLHRARAAQDRERRRHRGAAGHAGADAHHADHEGAERPHPGGRRQPGGAHAGRRRVHRRDHGEQGRLL